MSTDNVMCQPLAPPFAEVEERIKAAPRVSLFLDFDGTLARLAPNPKAARMETPVLETLRHISRIERIVTTIISGRAIEDLFSKVRLDHLIYAGNHGLEIFGRRLRFVEPAAAARAEVLSRLSEDLAAKLRSIPGAFVEYKGYTTSVHFRQASPAHLPQIEEAVRAAVDSASFRLNPGKKILEIVPRTDWHKGAAVRWINHRIGNGRLLSIYLGDDATDEDAFAVLPDGITVKVGEAPVTGARYQLPDPAAVRVFLDWLAETLSQTARTRTAPDSPMPA